ncbi:hypothetical protein QN277_027291 [Acacia crassicarpa]|uniref:Receptor-like serine/threonine-protein kinase n=1 Tax=Acacia crassicarpa TaxID=499986 RepID=A0AAE1MMT6_9FABA|nr:hypothetical protein QN277_027291 [Acacia crassicarpa]
MSSSLILPCILALVSFLGVLHAQNNPSPTLNLNSNITAGSNSSLKSPLGDFEFGFYHLPGDYYLVGIWFANTIPEKTLVWYSNPPVKANSVIQLSSRGHLVLIYPNGETEQIDKGNEVSANSAFLQDDGNLVMKDSNSIDVWQSFAHPTNTMLPGQVLNEDDALYSKGKGSLNYSNGNFRLLMQSDGNLVLIAYLWEDPSYWNAGTGSTNNDVTLVFNNTSASLYVAKDSINIHSLTNNNPTPTGEFYHRATIDENGNFHQCAYNRINSSGWIRIWSAIDDPCRVNAICGVNSLCSPDNESIKCECLPGFIPFNTTDVSLLGCRPETVINYCTQNPSMLSFKLEVLDDTDFQFGSESDFAVLEPADLEACKKYVMDDCNVVAATFNATSSTCAKKRMPLVNARKSSSSKGQKALLKVPNENNNATGRLQGSKKKSFNVRVFLKVMLAVSSTLACLFGALAVYYHPLARKLMRRNKFQNVSVIGINFREFTFQELHDATSGFSKTIGKGSSGKVYSGNLAIDDARIAIAVKKLDKRSIERSEQEFMTELKIIGRTHHKNLVRLLGFCVEKSHRLLVYELLPNGALSNFLFGQREKPHWAQRIDIALGIARGLLYLHEECETQIIHCDIKPQNVLLDANYTAKIADFGLSKLLNKEQTRTNTKFRGTIGYIAPEWLRSAPITSKVDVFSFGIMLLEIICCKRHVEQSQEAGGESDEDDPILAEWVLRCIVSKKLEELAGHDSEVLGDMKRFEQMALVGLWCIHPDAALRPTMKEANQMLEGNIVVGVPPLLYEQMEADQSL